MKRNSMKSTVVLIFALTLVFVWSSSTWGAEKGKFPTGNALIGFRIERFFLDNLHSAGVIDARADLTARFRLAIEGIRVADSLGYFVDRVPDICLSPQPPKWCTMAGGVITEGRLFGVVITDGRILLIDSLVANGGLRAESRIAWHKIARSAEFAKYAPSLLRQVSRTKKWSAGKALTLLDRSFGAVSGIAYPAPNGGYWDKYCREHPENRICWVIHIQFTSPRAQGLAREFVLVSLLEQEKLIQVRQARAIYDHFYRALPAGGVVGGPIIVGDLSIYAGVVITDGLKLKPIQRARISAALGASGIGYVVDPDSPCFKKDPPLWCKFANTLPVAVELTNQLIQHRIWPKEAALRAWSHLGKLLH